MISESPDGVYLFLYTSENDSSCEHDLWFEQVNDALEYGVDNFDIQEQSHESQKPPNNAYMLTTSTRFICLIRAWLLRVLRSHRFWVLLVAGEAAVAKFGYLKHFKQEAN
jgi:hypothetical protein